MVVVTPPASPAKAPFLLSPRSNKASQHRATQLASLRGSDCMRTPTLLGRRHSGLGKTVPDVSPAPLDLGKQSDDEVWLVVGGTGMAGYGTLKKLSERGEAGGLVLAPTRGSPEKAWMAGILPGITPVQADINDPETLRKALSVYPPVTHVFYSALVRTSFNDFSKRLDSMNVVTLRALQRSMGPACMRASSACCCGGTGVYDLWNSFTGCGDVEDNRMLFAKIFQALDPEHLRYCCLVTGAKHYGMHLGPSFWPQYSEPFVEDNAAQEAPGESAYVALEEELRELSVRLPRLSALVLRPSFILGAVPRPSGTCMNLGLCLAVYALLCKEIGKPLVFLGSPELWTALLNFSHSDRIAQLALNGGAALPVLPQGTYMALNASDYDAFCYAEIWPQLAAWAGCTGWEGPQGRDGISFRDSMDGRSSEALNDIWSAVAARHGLWEPRLSEVLNAAFLDQSMTPAYSARLSSQKSCRLHWASPSRDGGWSTLKRGLADLATQGLLPKAGV